jgi:hypothetical protein
MTRKGQTVPSWLMGVLAIVGVGALLISTGAIQNPLSTTGDGPSTAPSDDDAVASMSFKVKDALNDDLNYVTADYYVYDSDGLQVASGETSTSDFTTVSDLDENADYTVRVVDDDGSESDEMYSATKEITTGESVSRFVVDADRQGTLSTSIEEDSGADEDDSTLAISQGQTETFTLEMEENTADAAYNDPAVFVKTNDTDAISNVEVSGASEVNVPDRISSYDDGYDAGITQLVDFESGTVDVQVTRDDSNTDDATVTVLVADGDEYQTGQDTWEFGYEDDSDADIRATDYTETVDVVS